jgi:hypothetical protein
VGGTCRATLAAAAVAAILAAPAAHADGPRQTGGFEFTTTVPGAVSGARVSVQFQNPDDPAAKPYAVTGMVVHGWLVGDPSVRPQCTATDAQLTLEGPAGCPPDSKIGGGSAVADVGANDFGPFSRYQQISVSEFNAANGFTGVGVDETQPPITDVDHTTFVDSNTLSTAFPTFPGSPPPEPYTAIKSLDVSVPPYVSPDGRAYFRTPSTCPAVGYWTITGDFTYHDGVTQTIVSHAPCDRRAPRRPASRS